MHTLTPAASVHSAADAPLERLASRYHTAMCMVASIDDYDARKPHERYSEMLWAVGNYRFHGDWQRLLGTLEWPVPVSQRGVQKTENPWDKEAA